MLVLVEIAFVCHLTFIRIVTTQFFGKESIYREPTNLVPVIKYLVLALKFSSTFSQNVQKIAENFGLEEIFRKISSQHLNLRRLKFYVAFLQQISFTIKFDSQRRWGIKVHTK